MNLEINDRTTGYLVLLFILLVFHSLKPVLIYPKPDRSDGDGDLFIQLAGDLRSPGVYRFSHQPNLMDLIGRAGGLDFDIVLPEAFRNSTFSSGMQVTVHQEGNDTRFYLSEMSAFYKMTLGIPISLNEESETGLTALPGIGPGLAKAIVRKRSECGGFLRLDDVLSVKGIGPKLYERIEPYVVL